MVLRGHSPLLVSYCLLDSQVALATVRPLNFIKN